MAERTQQLTDLRRLTADDADLAKRFLQDLPEGDLTFFKEDVDDATVGRWVAGERFRRRGLGRRLARYGLAEAVRLGLRKIIVEVAAEKEGDIDMFTSIGFTAEALLRDHICDRKGNLRDLVILSHDVGEVASSMGVLGLDDEFGR